ncbi:hypothetical protein TYRP_012277 [Tyrophagus putrescentiae]|nr:hypothetical protein TYRP_012277 [Tyrophagus putrescentiae]
MYRGGGGSGDDEEDYNRMTVINSVIEVGLMSDDRFVVGHSAATAPGGGLLGQQVIALHQGIVGYGGGSAPTTS